MNTKGNEKKNESNFCEGHQQGKILAPAKAAEETWRQFQPEGEGKWSSTGWIYHWSEMLSKRLKTTITWLSYLSGDTTVIKIEKTAWSNCN